MTSSLYHCAIPFCVTDFHIIASVPYVHATNRVRSVILALSGCNKMERVNTRQMHRIEKFAFIFFSSPKWVLPR